MVGVGKAVSDELFEQAQVALKELGKVGKISRKLQAIIAAKKFGISMASEVFGTTRPSLMTWIKNFEKDAKKGLETKNGQGRKPITNAIIKDFSLQIMQKKPNTTNADPLGGEANCVKLFKKNIMLVYQNPLQIGL